MQHDKDDSFAALLGTRRGSGQPLSQAELLERALVAQGNVTNARRHRDDAVIAAIRGGVPAAALPQISIEAGRRLK